MTDQTTQADAPPAKTEETPSWATKFNTALEKMSEGISSLVTMAQQARQAPPPAEEPEVVEARSAVDDVNLELLPRREFARRMSDDFAARLEEALKPIQAQISQSQQAVLTETYTREATEFASRTPQMAEWEKEMMAIAERQPQLPISDIYHLARAHNPAKAHEMDTKYAAAAPQAEPAKPAAKKAPPLSMTPNSSPAPDVRNQRMGAEEAARSAWEESVAKFGNPFASG